MSVVCSSDPLATEALSATATENTGRVIELLRADILTVVEAENRPGLVHFNDRVIDMVGGRPYDHVMLIDGNDERGIDVGLLTRAAYPIDAMRSHEIERAHV